VVIFTHPIKVTERAKSQKAHALRIYPKTGNVRYAAPPPRPLNAWAEKNGKNNGF